MPDLAFYAFPTLDQLSKASEAALRAEGFGYRLGHGFLRAPLGSLMCVYGLSRMRWPLIGSSGLAYLAHMPDAVSCLQCMVHTQHGYAWCSAQAGCCELLHRQQGMPKVPLRLLTCLSCPCMCAEHCQSQVAKPPGDWCASNRFWQMAPRRITGVAHACCKAKLITGFVPMLQAQLSLCEQPFGRQ